MRIALFDFNNRGSPRIFHRLSNGHLQTTFRNNYRKGVWMLANNRTKLNWAYASKILTYNLSSYTDSFSFRYGACVHTLGFDAHRNNRDSEGRIILRICVIQGRNLGHSHRSPHGSRPSCRRVFGYGIVDAYAFGRRTFPKDTVHHFDVILLNPIRIKHNRIIHYLKIIISCNTNSIVLRSSVNYHYSIAKTGENRVRKIKRI